MKSYISSLAHIDVVIHEIHILQRQQSLHTFASEIRSVKHHTLTHIHHTQLHVDTKIAAIFLPEFFPRCCCCYYCLSLEQTQYNQTVIYHLNKINELNKLLLAPIIHFLLFIFVSANFFLEQYYPTIIAKHLSYFVNASERSQSRKLQSFSKLKTTTCTLNVLIDFNVSNGINGKWILCVGIQC